MSNTDQFLNALRSRHDYISSALGDDALYGAMSNYTGQSHLGSAIKSDLISDALFGSGIGGLTATTVLPALGAAISPKANKYGLIYGAGAGAALSALDSIARYYLGKGAANLSGG